MNIQTFRNAEILTLLFLSAFSFQFSAFSQGSLTPPGAPAPTFKTLSQIEPRTPISSAPFTVSAPGAYYVTTNITVATGNAVTVNANGVTLDLNGFTISSTASPAAGTGVLLGSGIQNITILNGHINGGVTYNAGTYSGPGFGNGIFYSGSTPLNVRVSNVTVSGCALRGIDLGTDYSSTAADRCTVRTVGSDGINAGSVNDCQAYVCGGNGINAITVANSTGRSTASGRGIYTQTAVNCYGDSVNGNGVEALTTASGCYGASTNSFGLAAKIANSCYGGSGNSTGLSAQTANNCYGYCSGGGTGVNVITANNCWGTSAGNGAGLGATTASNCYGDSGGSSFGLVATSAINCYGHSNGATGLYADQIAIGCLGYTALGGGTGLHAYIANSCYGNPSITYTYHYNMPP